MRKLDLNFVERRLMRASYGFSSAPIFIDDKHPRDRQFRDNVDGNMRCRGVMWWYARKVPLHW